MFESGNLEELYGEGEKPLGMGLVLKLNELTGKNCQPKNLLKC